MNSLRARIVVTLVSSIICVVVMATVTLFWMRKGHVQKEERERAQLISEGILLIAPLFGDDQKDRGAHLGSSPAADDPRPALTNLFQSQLLQTASDRQLFERHPETNQH